MTGPGADEPMPAEVRRALAHFGALAGDIATGIGLMLAAFSSAEEPEPTE